MGAFAGKGTVKVTVEGREGEWIEIKAALSVKETNHLRDVLMLMRMGDAKVQEAAMQLGSHSQALLEMAVVGWRLLDDEGQPVAFKQALVGELDPEDELVDKVLGEIAARFPLGGKTKKSSAD